MASPPLIDSRLAPGPLIVVVALSVSFSSPAVRVIVWGVLNRLEKVIVSAVGRALARLIAWRRLSSPGLDPTPSAVVLTMILGWVWKAPMSIRPVRGWPRWSVAGASVVVPPPIAGLPGSGGMVKVGPP